MLKINPNEIRIPSRVNEFRHDGVKGKKMSFYAEVSDLSGDIFMPEGKFNYSDVIFIYNDGTEVNSSRELEDLIYKVCSPKLV